MKKQNTIIGKINAFLGFGTPDESLQVPPPTPRKTHSASPSSESSFSRLDFSPWYPMALNVPFDGEKTAGELGMPINLVPMHQSLRLRAYEADLNTDIIKIITGKFFKWVVGTGLKLQSEPNEVVLKSEGFSEDLTDFRKITEERFKVWSESPMSGFTRLLNLHEIAKEGFKTAFLGGDCLVVCRIENKNLSVQIIDGQEVVNPDQDRYYKEAKERGNYIEQGIELNERGEHIAYFVRIKKLKEIVIERFQCKGENSGNTYVWMLYGNKHRINHNRGIPQISSILEKVSKLDRYTEASVASAEERAKIVYSVEHNQNSTGESPILDAMRQNFNNGEEITDPFEIAEKVTKNIKLTTNKQAFNMPIGAKLSVLDSQQELQYEPYFDGVFKQICAACDIPPEVALQVYNSNYSASRAAINGWEYIIKIYRTEFSRHFYRPIYSLWLQLEILKRKINSENYLKALNENNEMALEAFTSARFTGNNMPHIDPKKEVEAIRSMLGDRTKEEIPLISLDQATELLNQGDWADNINKYETELQRVDFLKPVETKEDDQNNG